MQLTSEDRISSFLLFACSRLIAFGQHRELKDDKDDSKDGDDKDEDEDDDELSLGDVVDIAVDSFGCFSAVATVQLQGKAQPVPMKNLEIGDRVLANHGKYEAVYAFGHQNPQKEAVFFQIYTSSSSEIPLEVTGEHLVYLHGAVDPVRADSIRVSDRLQHSKDDAREVTEIRTVARKGVYAPLTRSGKVVVDGIQASSYISLQERTNRVQVQGVNMPMSQQDFLHMALSPFRMMCQGISSSLCQVDPSNGIPRYIDFGMRFIKWGEEQPLVLQLFMLAVALVVLGAFSVVENTFSAPFAPMVSLIMVSVYGIMKVASISVRTGKPKTA